MKLETEYDKEDVVFFMHENKIASDSIKKITIVVEQGSNADVSYELQQTVQENGSSIRKKEKELFKSKKALIETL